MIKTERYGGGLRWHCTNCDTGKSSPGFAFSVTFWTNSKPPAECDRCDENGKPKPVKRKKRRR